MKPLSVVVLVAVCVVPCPGWEKKKHATNVELCSVKSVFIVGNSEAANVARNELEKYTWLKLENDESEADAKFTISEQRISQDVGGQAVTVSGEIMRGSKLLWSRSDGGPASFIGASAKAVTWTLLRHLKQEAACQ